MLSLDSSNESRDQEEGRGRKTEERINPLSIVGTQDLELTLSLTLKEGMKLLEAGEGIGFASEEVKEEFPRVVVDEGEDVAVSTEGRMGDIKEVRVDELANGRGTRR